MKNFFREPFGSPFSHAKILKNFIFIASFIDIPKQSTATAFCVTCMTTLTAKYGNFDQKGTVLGIFRSLGALARALGPLVSSTAFWCIGSTPTYLIGGFLLLYPAIKLAKLKLS